MTDLIDGQQLRELRNRLGLSLRAMARHAGISHEAVRLIERDGTSSNAYLACILALHATPPIASGRHWRRLPPVWHGTGKARWTDYGHAAYWLYLPGNAEHRFAIVAPPTGIGDKWMERLPNGKIGDPLRRLFERLPDGTVHYLGDIEICQ